MKNYYFTFFYAGLLSFTYGCDTKEKAVQKCELEKSTIEVKGIVLEIDSSRQNTKFLFTGLNNDSLLLVLNKSDISSPFVIFKNGKIYKEYKFETHSLEFLNANSRFGNSFEYFQFKNDLSEKKQSIYLNTNIESVDSLRNTSFWRLSYGGGYNFISGTYSFMNGKKNVEKLKFQNNQLIEIPFENFNEFGEVYLRIEVERNSKPDIAVINTINAEKTFVDTYFKVLKIN